MKYTKITITDDNVIGNEVKSRSIVNMTSVHFGLLKTILKRIPDLPDTLFSEQISSSSILMVEDVRLDSRRGKRKPVTIVVDQDDKTKDVKIRNICGLNQWVMVTLISIDSKAKPLKSIQSVAGTISQITNFNNTQEVMISLKTKALTANAIKTCSGFIIIKTDCKETNSISAMKMILHIMDKPFTIEKTIITYDERFCVTPIKRKIFSPVKMDKNLKQSLAIDKHWVNKTIYMGVVTTHEGIMILKEKQIDDKSRFDYVVLKLKEIILFLIDTIKDTMLWLINKIAYYLPNIMTDKINKTQTSEDNNE